MGALENGDAATSLLLCVGVYLTLGSESKAVFNKDGEIKTFFPSTFAPFFLNSSTALSISNSTPTVVNMSVAFS